MARGLEEVLEEPYLRYRIRSTEYLHERLVDAVKEGYRGAYWDILRQYG